MSAEMVAQKLKRQAADERDEKKRSPFLASIKSSLVNKILDKTPGDTRSPGNFFVKLPVKRSYSDNQINDPKNRHKFHLLTRWSGK